MVVDLISETNIKRRIKKYCKTNNWKKIIYISKENKYITNLIVNKKRKRNLIHLLSHKLLYDVLSLLSVDKNTCLITDRKKNTALHLALKSCIKKNLYADVVKFWDFFVERNSDIKLVKNKFDETPSDLLMLISNILDKPKPNKEWTENLEYEANSDYMNEWGKYEQDYFWEYVDYESYDNWSERINNEYIKKNFNSKLSNNNNYRPKSESKEKDKKLKPKYAKVRLESKYESFKHKWIVFESKIRLLQEADRICVDDIPWLPLSENISKMIFEYFGEEEKVRKELKLLQIIWHPDRFMNRCGLFINEVDKQFVLENVVRISQSINNAISISN